MRWPLQPLKPRQKTQLQPPVGPSADSPAIRDSQQRTSPIGFLFLKLPPPPCAVLLVIHDNTIPYSSYRYPVNMSIPVIYHTILQTVGPCGQLLQWVCWICSRPSNSGTSSIASWLSFDSRYKSTGKILPKKMLVGSLVSFGALFQKCLVYHEAGLAIACTIRFPGSSLTNATACSQCHMGISWTNAQNLVKQCQKLIEGSLEVKLPTIWIDGRAEVGRARGEKRRREIREEKESEERRCRCAKK